MNVYSHFRAILLHFLPVFSHFRLGLRKLIPGDRGASGRFFDHLDAIFDRTNVEAETAAPAIILADNDLWTRADGFSFAVGTRVIGGGRNNRAVRGNQVNTLVRGVIAGDVAEIAADAFRLVNACDGAEGEVEVLEVGDVMQTAADNVRNC